MIPYNSEERSPLEKTQTHHPAHYCRCRMSAIVAILAAGAMFIGTKIKNASGNSQNSASGAATASNQAQTEAAHSPEGIPSGSQQSPASPEETTSETPAQSLLSQASALAAGYDYDKAISLLQEDSQMASLPEVQSAIAQYETIRQSLDSNSYQQSDPCVLSLPGCRSCQGL